VNLTQYMSYTVDVPQGAAKGDPVKALLFITQLVDSSRMPKLVCE